MFARLIALIRSIFSQQKLTNHHAKMNFNLVVERTWSEFCKMIGQLGREQIDFIRFLIHELFPANLLSLQEPVNFGTPYIPLPFLNPTTYLSSNLTSANLISSPYLINFPFSFVICQVFVIGSLGLSQTLLTKTIKE